MIQLSDTKAAPGMGGLPGIKPKAGGDSSAFALALSGLVADEKLGISITLPRQMSAIGGNNLPDEPDGMETEDAVFQGFGPTVPPIMAGPGREVREAVGAGRDDVPTKTPKPLAATRTPHAPVPRGSILMEHSDRTHLADRRDQSQGSEPDARATDVNGPVAARGPAQPSTSPLPSVEPKPVAAHKTAAMADARPADGDTAPTLLAVSQTSLEVSREPETSAVPETCEGASGLTQATLMSVPPLAAPHVTFSEQPTPERAERAAVTAMMVGSSPRMFSEPGGKIAVQPSRSSVRTIAEPGVSSGDRPAIPPAGPNGASTAPRAAATVPLNPLPDAAPQTASVAHAKVSPEATPPSAIRATRPDRPALTARLQAAPATAASPRTLGATNKTPTDALNNAPAPSPSAKVDAPVQMPAKFLPVEPRIDAAPDRPAARRIAIASVDPAPSLVGAKPLTVADLIPVEQRPRLNASPTAMVTDPASVGLSAPVEAPDRIADPAPIDTQATDWIEGMIEQIDVMREAHAEGASETSATRIRLSPDALGAVEIMLVGEGEAFEVRINADTAAARTLLAEAAPRLADMAEARGLKLAQGDAGQTGQHQAQRQQQQDQPTANRRRHDAADQRGSTDERIA